MVRILIKVFSSLRLTVVCLAAACVVVVIGTIAQAEIGIYEAHKRFFKSFFVYWSPGEGSLKIPVFFGGYLVGGVLLANLIAAHAARFSFSRKKVGIFMIHAGLILLLLAQLFTDIFQVESNMRLVEGRSVNFSESIRYNELAVIDVTEPDQDTVVSIPARLLKTGQRIRYHQLPFVIRAVSYDDNSEPVRMDSGRPEATAGVGRVLQFEKRPVTYEMNKRNIPAALIEITADDGPLGTWTVSNWISEAPLAKVLLEWNASLGEVMAEPQGFEHNGRQYQIALRPIRYYKPFFVYLDTFTHDRYPGTDVPRNFQSDVRIIHPEIDEDRPAQIFMNNPLRYGGETYYQGSFDPEDAAVSILHVVRNPVWQTPYWACGLVGLGLVVQFTSHLVGFAGRRRRS